MCDLSVGGVTGREEGNTLCMGMGWGRGGVRVRLKGWESSAWKEPEVAEVLMLVVVFARYRSMKILLGWR